MAAFFAGAVAFVAAAFAGAVAFVAAAVAAAAAFFAGAVALAAAFFAAAAGFSLFTVALKSPPGRKRGTAEAILRIASPVDGAR